MTAGERPASAPDYRADIDGLRALAVIAVVLFHAEVAGFGGGYVGVDVFFVISGYLITRLLVAGHSRSQLSLADFYLRRARRILPALLTMMAVACIAAAILYTPLELRYFGHALGWCAAMLGNVAALATGDYFEPPWGYVPLRHLWSIAVEEQFYLVYPLFLMLVLRFAPRWLPALVATLGLLSFGLCAWAQEAHPVANYFAPMTRAWELLAGAWLALEVVRPVANRRLAGALAVFALLALLTTVVVYIPGLPFPGWYALPPVIATLLLLLTGADGGTFVHRALAWRPLVFVGLISYSLYLWHAPVQVFVRYFVIEKPTGLGTVVTLAATVAIAVASWACVEQPIRRRRVLARSELFVPAAVGASLAGIAVGSWLWFSDGLPGRFSPQVLALIRNTQVYRQDAGHCMEFPLDTLARGDLCRFGASGPGRPTAILWGDSHALMLLPAFDQLAQELGMTLLFAARSECRPLSGVRSPIQGSGVHGYTQRACEQFNQAMTRAVQQTRPDVVVFAAYWNHPDASLVSTDGTALPTGESGMGRGIRATLGALGAGAPRRCVVLDVPTLGESALHAVSMAERRGIAADFLRLPRAAALEQTHAADAAFRELEQRGILRAVDPKDALCAGPRCRVQGDQGELLYWDDNHLTIRGALFVAPALARCLHR